MQHKWFVLPYSCAWPKSDWKGIKCIQKWYSWLGSGIADRDAVMQADK